MLQRTLAIVKPDGVKNGVAGQVIARIEKEGFRIVAMRLHHLGRAEAEGFYAVHKERPFYNDLVAYMTSGPVWPLALERDNAIPSLQVLLDEAASKLVGDVNADGDINYTDILRWNVYLHRDLYRGDAAALQQLDAAITLGLPPAEIQHQVLVMLGEYTPPPEPGLLDFVKLKLSQNLQQP